MIIDETDDYSVRPSRSRRNLLGEFNRSVTGGFQKDHTDDKSDQH
jgi:hypothetical protein